MKISVLISVWEKEKPTFFKKALDSILSQTLPANEVVLVKDGPLTPDLEAVVDKYQVLLPLKIIVFEKNKGLRYALNAGLKECSNNWVARMDSDDICLPERLEVTARFIETTPSADIIGSFAHRIDFNGRIIGLMRVPVKPLNISKLVWTCPMIHPTVCYRKDKILAIGGYNENAGPRQDDYELWYRCVSAGYEFRNIPRPLLLYRFTYDTMRRNNYKVGWHQLKNGFRGNRMVRTGLLAYVGVTVPFLRSLLPFPINIWVYKLQNKLNPRVRKA